MPCTCTCRIVIAAPVKSSSLDPIPTFLLNGKRVTADGSCDTVAEEGFFGAT